MPVLEITPASVVVATRDQLSSDLGRETVVLNMEAGIYYGLDDVGGRVWALVQQPCRVGDLCARLLEEYEVDEERCRRAVIALLGEMRAAGLIEVADGPVA